MSGSEREERPTAVLVGLQLPGVSDADHRASLAELSRLVHTMGLAVVGTVSQKRSAPAVGTVVGEGKLRQIARYTGGTGAVASKVPEKRKKKPHGEEEIAAALDYELGSGGEYDEEDGESLGGDGPAPGVKADKVIFDLELTPNQMRNLETATGTEILDRTGVIVEIFHRHARTREARMQVEIARLKYLAPRLRQARAGADRSGGGIGAKGVGETAHELDRRRIRDRIAELSKELEVIQQSHDERRQRRSDQLKIALVGYTNAGKSSLMRALTGSEVLVEDKLFATLETTVRAMHPETKPRILVSDTVGFIKKLPHDLVASFRSTLDEAGDATLLLFVVDASDPTFRAQLEVTREVLKDIGALNSPSLLILNKWDAVDEAGRAALRAEFPEAVPLSTREPEDVARLRGQIVAFFEQGMSETELFVPFAKGAVLGEIRRLLRVLSEEHLDTGTKLKVLGQADAIGQVRKALGDR